MTDAGFVAAGWLLTAGVLAGYGLRLAARTRSAQAMVDAAEARRLAGGGPAGGGPDDDGARSTGASSP